MDTLTFNNLDQTASFKHLQEQAPFGTTPRGPIADYTIEYAAGLRYNWASRIDPAAVPLLRQLAHEQQCIPKYKALAQGEVANPSEQRRVLHHLLRGELVAPVIENGVDLGSFYRTQLNSIIEYARAIRRGTCTAPNGQRYSAVVQVGIGGSELGPRALYLALHHCTNEVVPAYFISNVDIDNGHEVLGAIDPATTLFIVVSKSGTTIETAHNEKLIVEYLTDRGIAKPYKQIIAVTAKQSPMAADGRYLQHFFIDNHIGGRFSATGAVGILLLALCYGEEIVRALLAGVHQADKIALTEDPLKNPPLLDALCGIYERNIMQYPVYALLPYCNALAEFPAHIQQLDMESNGKSVNRYGQPLDYATGSIIFGGVGTNVQHSFYQLLHQGSTVVPMIFVGFANPHNHSQHSPIGTTFQHLLNANLAAQIVAYSIGEKNSNLNNHFVGNRPSSLLWAKRLTPEVLGALLSFFENRVMFQGFLWNINSFDQPGVQLGKKLATRVLNFNPNTKSSTHQDSLLREYSQLIAGK